MKITFDISTYTSKNTKTIVINSAILLVVESKHMANIDDIDVDEEYGAIAENVGTKVQEKVRI